MSSSGVEPAVISGIAAVVVSLWGVGGALVAGKRSANKALEAQRELFVGQVKEADRVRAEAVAREDAARFADTRRDAYAAFVSACATLAKLNRQEQRANRISVPPGSLDAKDLESIRVTIEDNLDVAAREIGRLYTVIALLAPDSVSEIAGRILDILTESIDDLRFEQLDSLLDELLDSCRADLGLSVDGGPDPS